LISAAIIYYFSITVCIEICIEILLERLNKEIKRRTRVATLFPNEASLLRLVSAVLMEISEEWETEKIYLKIYLRMENSGALTSEE